MTSNVPPLRLADYFFVVGIQDKDIITKYEAARSSGGSISNESYFNVNAAEPKEQTQGVATLDNTMLDHVATVIQNFDKDRDMARDTVIAVWDGTGQPSPSRRKSVASATNAVLKSGTRRMSSATSRPSSKSISALDRPSINDTDRRSLSNDRHSVSEETTMSPPIDHAEKDKVPNIFETTFPPAVLLRYPKADHSPLDPFPSHTPMFCFPNDITFHYGSSPPPETVHSFSTTDEDGNKKYGTCVTFYERLPKSLYEDIKACVANWVKGNMSSSTREYAQHLKEKIDVELDQLKEHRQRQIQLAHLQTTSWIQEERDEVEELLRVTQEKILLYRELLEPVKLANFKPEECWIPKSVGVITQLPWFELMSDWIRIVVDAIIGVKGKRNPQAKKFSLENAIYNLIHELRIPPRGIYEIGITINERILYLNRPSFNDIPILKNFSLYPLFRCLSPNIILAIIEVLLSEGKVLFLSKKIGMLAIAGESVQYLLYPFYWQFVYIPVLPKRLITCLQAPVPYIIGFNGSMDEIGEDIPEDTCVINLDTNTIHQMIPPPSIPVRQRRKLLSGFEEFAALHTRFKIPYGIPLPVREAYPNGRLPLSNGRSKTMLPLEQRRPRYDNIADNHTYGQGSGIFSRPLSEYLTGNQSVGSLSKFPTGSSEVDITAAMLPQRPGSAVIAQVTAPTPSTPPLSRAQSYSGLHSRPMLPPSPGTTIMSSYFSNMSATTAATESANGQGNRAQGGHSNSSSISSRNGVLGMDDSDMTSSGITSGSTSDTEKRESKLKNRLSALMPKPKAAFQDYDTARNSTQQQNLALVSSFNVGPGRASFPPTMLDNSIENTNSYRRRCTWVEGHCMLEIFNNELTDYVGYRCICGKEISRDMKSDVSRGRESDPLSPRMMFMSCTECKLITHEGCTNQILHPCIPTCFDEQQIVCAFLRTYSSLLWNYRAGFAYSIEELNGNAPLAQSDAAFPPDEQQSSDPTRQPRFFSKERFLKGCDRDTRDYLSQFVNSQMFTQFITDRLTRSPREYEVLFFDELIKLKLNRSKLKLLKEDTPFLDDDSFAVSQTVWAQTPNSHPASNMSVYEEDDARFPTKIHDDMQLKTAAAFIAT
ncbi:hypothetical protein K450DRAFT_257121 [Umbelopsis ramanniana AG]|uniref:UDENN domain-containing protein n=1 Tax=Umbelopsis ramanniana AG TaxID=1314678 RepID=A0AAD5HB33_UMBRA|nr:uncharacterized protein K450DRAFT_257121 [Umbelopsis ramanniana AG]KAI8576404.1 hypothetical protein K450DRAFT_257121 [Umbelopsis ramanniana AG]